jgi:hypothetical protein
VAGAKLIEFQVEKLVGEAEHEGGAVVARLAGSASHRDLTAFDHFLAVLLGDSRRLGAATIVLDLRDVGYMNSSHLKSLVSWLGTIAKAEPRLEVTLRTNPDHHWQKRSMEALAHLADGLVTVES